MVTEANSKSPYRGDRRRRRRIGQTLFLALAALSSLACRQTTVLVPPHASPYDSSSGLALHEKFGGAMISVGVVAVNDGRTDVSWETREGSKELWACRGSSESVRPPDCQPARYEGGEPLRDLIRFLAPPIARDASATHPDESPSEAAGDERDREDVVAVPRHGVWVAGKVSFLSFPMYHCIVDARGPVCKAVANDMFEIVPGVPLSRHIVRSGDRTADVLWMALGAISRCQRIDETITCQLATME